MMHVILLLFLLTEPPAFVRPISFTPEFWVVVDEDYANARQLKARDVFEIASGTRTLRFIHPRHSDQVLPVTVSPGDTLNLSFSMPPLRADRYGSSSSFLRLTTGGNVLINTDHDTAVMLGTDTLSVGAGYVILPTEQRHSVLLISSFGRESFVEIDLTNQPIQVLNAYLRPDRYTTRWMAIILGGAAYYKQEYLKATLLGLIGFSSIGFATKYYAETADRITSYNEAVRDYKYSTTMALAIQNREKALRRKTLADQSALRRDVMFSLAAGMFVYSVWDAFQPPKFGFRSEENAVDFVLNPTSVGVKISFR
jgi:hypothetical protein